MVAEWDCIVRNLRRVADGRVKPVHDGGGKSRYFRRLVLQITKNRRAAWAVRVAKREVLIISAALFPDRCCFVMVRHRPAISRCRLSLRMAGTVIDHDGRTLHGCGADLSALPHDGRRCRCRQAWCSALDRCLDRIRRDAGWWVQSGLSQIPTELSLPQAPRSLPSPRRRVPCHLGAQSGIRGRIQQPPDRCRVQMPRHARIRREQVTK